MAPEAMDDASYGYFADVYSCGILMYEIISRRLPYGNTTGNCIIVKVLRGMRPDVKLLPSFVGADDDKRRTQVQHLVEACWSQDTEARPSAAEAAATLHAIVHPLVPE